MALFPSSNWTTLDFPALRQNLLDLLCTRAYQEGNFVLSSGQKSTYYLNSKPVTLHPQGAVAVGRLLLPLLLPETVAVAGLTLGADPMVTATSVVAAYGNQELTPLIVRKEAKGHGTRAYIEGPTLPDQSLVAVLEDVVTTGNSALKAVQRLGQGNYQVKQVLALVDRQQGGAQLYAQAGLQFQALFTIQEVQQRWHQLQDAGAG
jgi:orotate phosphoribosyltransferase